MNKIKPINDDYFVQITHLLYEIRVYFTTALAQIISGRPVEPLLLHPLYVAYNSCLQFHSGGHYDAVYQRLSTRSLN